MNHHSRTTSAISSPSDAVALTAGELRAALLDPGAVHPGLAAHVLAQLHQLGRAVDQDVAA